MNTESRTVTNRTSWCSRLGESINNILFAFVIGLIGIGLLVWNEGNAVRQHKAFEEGMKLVVSVHDITTIDTSLDGKLVHVVGTAQSNDNVIDPLFGINMSNTVLKLSRKVEMYQWVESSHTHERKETGGSTTTETTYTYDKQWKSTIIDSNSFYDKSSSHQNPNRMRYMTNQFISSNITLGAYTITGSNDLVQKIDWFVPLDHDISITNIPKSTRQDEPLPIVQYGSKGFYIGYDSNRPYVGDIRILYDVVPTQIISIIGRQTFGSFTTYTSKSGGKILLVESGIHDPIEMFEHAIQSLQVLTWILRCVGFLCIFISFQLLVQPLVIVADVLPCIGNMVEAGTTCINFLLAIIVSTIIIAISWLANRPILSCILLCIASIIGYGIYRLITNNTSKNNNSTGPSTSNNVYTYESIPFAEASVIPDNGPFAPNYTLNDTEVMEAPTYEYQKQQEQQVPVATMVTPSAPYEY